MYTSTYLYLSRGEYKYRVEKGTRKGIIQKEKGIGPSRPGIVKSKNKIKKQK
jgi:hypothetical protein